MWDDQTAAAEHLAAGRQKIEWGGWSLAALSRSSLVAGPDPAMMKPGDLWDLCAAGVKTRRLDVE